MTTLEMHTGSTKNGTYRKVVGTVVEYGVRPLTWSHSVRTVTIRTADGELFTEAMGRTKEVEEMQETPQVEETQAPQVEIKVSDCKGCTDGTVIHRNGIYAAHLSPMRRGSGEGYRRSSWCYGRRPSAAWDTIRETREEALASIIRVI